MSSRLIRNTSAIILIEVIVGAVSSVASIAFVSLVVWMNDILLVSLWAREKGADSFLELCLFLLVPAAGGLAVGLILRDLPEGRAQSLVQTIRMSQSMVFQASFMHAFKTAVAALVTLGSGASMGQYGPVSHIGATLGLVMEKSGRAFGFTANMGIGCGVAAAISTVFNAPIAGLVFAHEVILRHFSLKLFAPVAVASVVGYLVANHVFDRHQVFVIAEVGSINPEEFLVFALIGIAGALVATGFVRMMLYFTDVSRRLRTPSWMKPAIAGAVMGLSGLWLPEILGVGEPVMQRVLVGTGYPGGELLLILVMKLVLTALCFGFGMAGSVFSPSLLCGIVFGALISIVSAAVMGSHYSSATPYMVCGMVALVGPVMGSPLTAILIIFELTRNYDLAVAAMVSAVFANLIGYRLIGRSTFDVQLEQQNFDLSMGRDKVIMGVRDIAPWISKEFTAVPGGASLAQAKRAALDSNHSELYVIDGENAYLGTLSLLEIGRQDQNGLDLSSLKCEDYCKGRVVFTPDTSIWTAMERIKEFAGESLPVVETLDRRKLVGVVYESSIVNAYLDSLKEARDEEHGASWTDGRTS
ncbi:MAG: chloride channel protein [Gammaproteobacteria bacterium]|nr:chloride channel protein [Gammaproteobacteria bacterium]